MHTDIATVKLDLYTGLLGVGKTTLIKRMLATAYRGKRIAIVENEIGRVNLDSHEFGGITIREITAGCICCTLQGNLQEAIRELVEVVHPEYIIIEATGLADIQTLTRSIQDIPEVIINRSIMLVNARKVRALLKVVGEFYYQQLQYADQIYLNYADRLTPQELEDVTQLLSEINPAAHLVADPMAEIQAGTFPENDVTGENLSESAAQPYVHLPLRRNAEVNVIDANKLEAPVTTKIQSGKSTKNKTLYTYTYQLKDSLTTDELEDLKTYLADPVNAIWRAKGILTTEDGRKHKIDVSFGDLNDQDTDIQLPEDALVIITEKRPNIVVPGSAPCKGAMKCRWKSYPVRN